MKTFLTPSNDHKNVMLRLDRSIQAFLDSPVKPGNDGFQCLPSLIRF
jgi:hypothetical protein